MRTKFVIYDQQPQYEGAKLPNSRCRRWLASKQINPLISTGIVDTGEVSCEYNLLKSRGPRRIHCSVQCPADDGTMTDPEEANQPSTPLVLYNKLPRLAWAFAVLVFELSWLGSGCLCEELPAYCSCGHRGAMGCSGWWDGNTSVWKNWGWCFYNGLQAASVGIPGICD